MDIDKYLHRIDFSNKVVIDDTTLMALHHHHVMQVPFENLDIHYRRPFDLSPENVYKKVIVNGRGGFCYELNSIFHAMLAELGFANKIISARIVDESGALGPEYDHMVFAIDLQNKQYLGDVGYGDLFTVPLEIKEGVQSDGRSQFKIERLNGDEFMLSMSSDGVAFVNKYCFSLSEVPISKFHGICIDKQTNPASYFVKNTICTKPTKDGRLTLLNDRFIERIGDQKIEKAVRTDADLRDVLKTKFAISL